MGNNESIIKIEHLSKSFGDKKVLNDINLEIKRGEFIPFSVRRAAAKPRFCDCSPDSTAPTKAR